MAFTTAVAVAPVSLAGGGGADVAVGCGAGPGAGAWGSTVVVVGTLSAVLAATVVAGGASVVVAGGTVVVADTDPAVDARPLPPTGPGAAAARRWESSRPRIPSVCEASTPSTSSATMATAVPKRRHSSLRWA
jgi:hypothetical protein